MKPPSSGLIITLALGLTISPSLLSQTDEVIR
jgi:hypothetical protein